MDYQPETYVEVARRKRVEAARQDTYSKSDRTPSRSPRAYRGRCEDAPCCGCCD